MTKQTYSTKIAKRHPSQSDMVAIYRQNIHYPRGVFVARMATQAIAEAWIARQVAEDAADRARCVRDYLAMRAVRPAPVAVPGPKGKLNRQLAGS
jgi:hypothetical protein